MFWARIRLRGREYLGVLDTGATISIVAKKILPRRDLKNIMPTAAIRMGDGHVMHSCGDCEVEVPMGSRGIAHRFYVMDTEAFCRYKTKMDERSGFWQVDPTPNAQELLAFITPLARVFKWKVMPFGVANAPALFQELMNKILSILRWRPVVQ